MIKVPVISAAALILGIGYALAVDENQGTSPTADPSSSGRPSAILSQNECQDLWSQALNQSSSGIAGSPSGQSSSGMAPGTSSGSPSSSDQGSPSVAGANNTGSASGSSNMGQSGQSSSSDLSTSASSQGALSKEQATSYIANFAAVDKNSDGQVSEAEFQDGCQNGWVQAASQSGSGKSGSSSSSSESGG